MYLLDTHALLWAVGEPHKLGPRARAAVESSKVKVSIISAWELIVKRTRKGSPVMDPLPWWKRHITDEAYEVLTIRFPHVIELDRLPPIHADPFDRMLIAQARAEELKIVTNDAMIARYDVEVVW